MDATTLVGVASEHGSPLVALLAALVGVVTTVMYGLIWGKIVPERTVNRREADWAARLAESHAREIDWKAAFERSDERLSVLSAQLGEMMQLGRTTEALVRAIQVEGRRADARDAQAP